MRFDLRNGRLPILTTKNVLFNNILGELLWMLSGSTDSEVLSSNGIKIWDYDGDPLVMESRGLGKRKRGQLGPVYGHQMRHYGADWVEGKSDYKGEGIDQISDLIKKIKKNPNDRRLVMNLYNPSQVHLMSLPPCHMFCQFFVTNGELSCHLYQRSGDMGLGVPYNITSYCLLLCIIANITGLGRGDFIHTIGDCHIYKNHIDALKYQCEFGDYFAFPILEIGEISDIDSLKKEDFKLIGKKSSPSIYMQLN
jgi:thymidylate synthase